MVYIHPTPEPTAYKLFPFHLAAIFIRLEASLVVADQQWKLYVCGLLLSTYLPYTMCQFQATLWASRQTKTNGVNVIV